MEHELNTRRCIVSERLIALSQAPQSISSTSSTGVIRRIVQADVCKIGLKSKTDSSSGDQTPREKKPTKSPQKAHNKENPQADWRIGCRECCRECCRVCAYAYTGAASQPRPSSQAPVRVKESRVGRKEEEEEEEK